LVASSAGQCVSSSTASPKQWHIGGHLLRVERNASYSLVPRETLTLLDCSCDHLLPSTLVPFSRSPRASSCWPSSPTGDRGAARISSRLCLGAMTGGCSRGVLLRPCCSTAVPCICSSTCIGSGFSAPAWRWSTGRPRILVFFFSWPLERWRPSMRFCITRSVSRALSTGNLGFSGFSVAATVASTMRWIGRLCN
jgi:hypothetical protein